jgi:hypothetical protein
MQARCGAHCRTTGNPCLNFPMPNGRCRMHGGRGAGRPVQHGYYTREAVAKRKELQELVSDVRRLLDLSLAAGVSQDTLTPCHH